MVGGIIMAHGDDKGLRLPPRLAPIQVVIVPIVKKDADREAVEGAGETEREAWERLPCVEACHGCTLLARRVKSSMSRYPSLPSSLTARQLCAAAEAAGLRARVDDRPDRSPGWKFSDWEMRGVPVRVEVGPRDVQQGTCVVARRDRPGKEGKEAGVPMEAGAFVAHVRGALDGVQASLFEEARAFRDANIVDVASYDELVRAVGEGKWARGGWAASDADERRVKEETGGTLRCFPFEQPVGPKTCLMTGKPAEEVAIFAKAY